MYEQVETEECSSDDGDHREVGGTKCNWPGEMQGFSSSVPVSNTGGGCGMRIASAEERGQQKSKKWGLRP
jgi:hypothetical protein